MNLPFAARCAIASACLPKSDYRAKLEALHAEMLAALAQAAKYADHCNGLIAAYKEVAALAQAGAEPVAWLYECGASKSVSTNYVPGVRATPLYAGAAPAAPSAEPLYPIKTAPMPNPTASDLIDPVFEAIWQATKSWDVNSPEYYQGYCGLNGSHVKIILDAVRSAAPLPAREPLTGLELRELCRDFKGNWQRVLRDHWDVAVAFAEAIEAAHGITAPAAQKEAP